MTALFVAALLSAPAALASCGLYETLKQAEKHADDTAGAFNTVDLPEDLQVLIAHKLTTILFENPAMELTAALDQVESDLSPADKARALPWLVAKKAREAADAEYERAKLAYGKAANEKASLLDAAEKSFDAEQKWLESEKQAIKDVPRDDAYLERVSRITARLRAAYEKMRTDLGPFRECFGDVDIFLRDKEQRLQRIDLLDREIARRRALAPGATTASEEPVKPVAGAWTVTSTRLGSAVPPLDDKGENRDVASISAGRAEFTAERKPASEGAVTIVIQYGDPPPKVLKPGDTLDLTCSAEASSAGKSPPPLGGTCAWHIEREYALGKGIEYSTSPYVGIDGYGNFHPNGKGRTKFTIGVGKPGDTVEISAVEGVNANWLTGNHDPATYVYTFNP